MITEKELAEAIKEFAKLEKRGSFYNMAVNLIDNKFELEAYFLILSTWNFAVFRYALKDFDIDGFKKQIIGLTPCFNKMKNESFKSIDFSKYKADIIKIYETLSAIKGVQFTGASKIMHLKNRNIFVMWDDYIRGNKPKKYYAELKIVKDGQWQFKEYGKDGENYFQYLKDMQVRFKYINFQALNKSFTKAIDEYNYVNITLPIQKIEKGKKIVNGNNKNRLSTH